MSTLLPAAEVSSKYWQPSLLAHWPRVRLLHRIITGKRRGTWFGCSFIIQLKTTELGAEPTIRSMPNGRGWESSVMTFTRPSITPTTYIRRLSTPHYIQRHKAEARDDEGGGDYHKPHNCHQSRNRIFHNCLLVSSPHRGLLHDEIQASIGVPVFMQFPCQPG